MGRSKEYPYHRTRYSPRGATRTPIVTPIATEREECIEQSLDTPAIESHEEQSVESFDDALDIDALLGLTPAVAEESSEPQEATEEVEEVVEAVVEESVEVEESAEVESVVTEIEDETEDETEDEIEDEVKVIAEPTVESTSHIEEAIAEPTPEIEATAQDTPSPMGESLFGIEDSLRPQRL